MHIQQNKTNKKGNWEYYTCKMAKSKLIRNGKVLQNQFLILNLQS